MRTLAGLAGGVVIGVIVIEALLAGSAKLIPDAEFYRAVVWGIGMEPRHLLMFAALWLIGGLSSGLMATAVSRRRFYGCLSGICLAIPVLLFIELGGQPRLLLPILLPAPMLGAYAGAWIAGRILAAETIVTDKNARTARRVG